MLVFRTFVCLAIFAIAASLGAAAKDLAVVVNKSNDMKTVTAADLTKILKAANKKWPNGQDVVIVLRDTSAPSMKVVLQKVYGMSAEQAKALISAANAGHATFVTADSDDVVLKMVASNSAAIGFVDVYSINSSVNVVKVDGKMPLEPGYLLHGVW